MERDLAKTQHQVRCLMKDNKELRTPEKKKRSSNDGPSKSSKLKIDFSDVDHCKLERSFIQTLALQITQQQPTDFELHGNSLTKILQQAEDGASTPQQGSEEIIDTTQDGEAIIDTTQGGKELIDTTQDGKELTDNAFADLEDTDDEGN